MAIAFGAVGTPSGVSVTTSGAVAVAVPAGVVSGNLLLVVLTYDCNTNPTGPAGWTLVQRKRAGTASGSFQPPTTEVWRKVSNGTEGASQTWTFSTSTWPAGRPDVNARMLSYTGTDTATPVEVSAAVSGTSESVSILRAMPQLTTATPNGWLVTVWGLSGTVSGSTITPTDTNRTSGAYNSLTVSVWDSNAALAAGAQAQRTTTTSSLGSWDGDVGITLALKILPSAGAGVAQAQTAQIAVQAYGPTSASVNGPWDLCGDDGLPVYTWAVDWPQTGMQAAGKILNTNPYPQYTLTGWSALHASLALAPDPQVTTSLPRNLHTVQVTPSGTDASGGAKAPHTAVGSIVPGQQYVADYWLYVPAGWANVQVGVDWLDASDTLLSTSLNTFSAAPAATWYHLTATFTAPASASRGGVFSRYGSTPSSSTLFYVWGLLLMDPLQAESRITPSPLDVVQPDLLASGAAWAYGRDQMRQISPAALGTASFSVNNSRRRYSPDVVTSPLNGNLDAARPMTGQVQFGGHTYPLFTGRIDDYNVHADINNRTVDFSFLDASAAIQTTPVTTGLYAGIRTGDAVNIILDQVGWTGPRDIDPGATVMPWWWLDSTNAGDAVNDLLKSEGPPSIAYTAPDGTFVYRDRTHRLLRQESLAEQGQYTAAAFDCASPPATGLSFTGPVTYSHGWRDIINSVGFQVGQRQIAPLPTAVWSSTSSLSVATGQTVVLSAVASDPFIGAITPALGTDYTVTGAGTLVVTLSQTSGLSTQIMLQAVSGDVVVAGMQVRAYSIPVVNTITVSRSDPTSVDQHGTKSYPETAPWAGAADADAIAQSILAKYSQRRPLVQLRVVSSDPVHFVQVLQRTVSDLIRITDGELGIDADFYVEHVAHQADRMGWSARPPVHAVILGCEQQGAIGSSNPFTFDLRGAGFDQGVWDPPSSDDPATVFIFDDPVQGAFNVGRLGT
jgi:hypothetical protein